MQMPPLRTYYEIAIKIKSSMKNGGQHPVLGVARLIKLPILLSGFRLFYFPFLKLLYTGFTLKILLYFKKK